MTELLQLIYTYTVALWGTSTHFTTLYGFTTMIWTTADLIVPQVLKK